MINPPPKKRRIDPKRDIITVEQAEQIEQNRLFFNRIRQTPIVTLTLLVTILVFWMISVGIALKESSLPFTEWLGNIAWGSMEEQKALIKLGGKLNFLIDSGQTWRFVSPMFLHFGLIHILLNGYALYLLGKMIENVYGKRRFLIIYLVSGIAGVVASYLSSPSMSVGASGAIFGLIGAATVAGYKHKEDIPPFFHRFYGRGMIPWILFNLILGFSIDRIDNSAHVGGLIGGTVMALFLRAKIDSKYKPGIFKQIVLSLTALACVLVMVFTIVNMFGNYSRGNVIAVPEQWKKVENPDADISAKVPRSMVALDVGSGKGSQYVEPHMGFWVALELDTDSEITLDGVVNSLWMEVNNNPAIDPASVKFNKNNLDILGGHAARRVQIEFVLTGKNSVESQLDVWVAPTDSGVVSATCSAPKEFYPMFKLWCREFIGSIKMGRN